ncbi:ArsR/SmtB family transcription factor [Streptacidiphilus carbonis]|uniref:ArsR/SmtB family transcription factor n=1 Tax=Streptacidiphilus carbonis TaxID=105422 RepID=UPI0005AA4868|nr:helix-turn-helix domain-containing protein [Streptacidiphilus carbonis]
MAHQDPDPAQRLTPDSVKVLAHPLRTRLLGELHRGGPATATTLAAELGTHTGATSYHLRRMAEVGLVEDTGQGAGRRRLWRAASSAHSWAPSDFADDADAGAALAWVLRDYHREFDEQYTQWLDRESGWPSQWRDATGMSSHKLTLTPAQLRALAEEMEQLLTRYRHAGPDDADQARQVAVWQFAFPASGETSPEVGT